MRASSQKGLSLVELIGALVVISFITIAAILIYGNLKEKAHVEQVVSLTERIAKNVDTHYRGKYFSYEVMQEMYNNNLLPKTLKFTVLGPWNIPINPWGGLLLISRIINATYERKFIVSYTQVPVDACIKLSTRNWGPTLTAIQFNPNTFAYAGNMYTNLPLSLSIAQAECQAMALTAPKSIFSSAYAYAFILKGGLTFYFY